MNVMVELRDRLYPGSYYTLTYDPSEDQLSGVYHHLGVHQDFDVVFMRVEPIAGTKGCNMNGT